MKTIKPDAGAWTSEFLTESQRVCRKNLMLKAFGMLNEAADFSVLGDLDGLQGYRSPDGT